MGGAAAAAAASILIGDSGTFFDEIGGMPIIGVEVDTLPMEARGSAYRDLDEGTPFFDDMTRLGGGAMSEANGSFEAGVLKGAGAPSGLGVMIGGGANGLATSAGSSPGNIQRFNFSS